MKCEFSLSRFLSSKTLQTKPPSFLRLTFSFLLVAAFASSAYSQKVSSRVTGTVKDQGEAVVSGAKITLVDVDSHEAKTTTTNDQGYFTFSEIRPGNYVVSAEGTGFKKSQVNDVAVHVDAPVVLNITLEPGGITETVSVTASEAQSLIRSEDAKLTTIVDVRQVQARVRCRLRGSPQAEGARLQTSRLRDVLPPVQIAGPF